MLALKRNAVATATEDDSCYIAHECSSDATKV